MKKQPEKDVAIIGLPWTLSLLQYSTNIHNISITWHSVSENHFFFDHMLQSVDSLTCHGNHYGSLPLEPLVPFFSFFNKLPTPWPCLDLFSYADINSLSHRYKLKKTWFIESEKTTIKHASYPDIQHDGTGWLVNEDGPYYSIIQITPYANYLSPHPIDVQTYSLFCSKPDRDRFFLSWEAERNTTVIKWSIYKDMYWLENWRNPIPTAIWCLPTPFNNEKFLNKKKIFESFLKKIAFLTRQHSFRIR